MKIKFTPLNVSLSAGLLLLLPGMTQAQPTAHYCPGAEGLDAASVPPPGIYVRDYNMFYSADHVNNAAGQKLANVNAFIYANVPRIIWMSETKFLGADVGADALLPLVDTHLDGHVPTFGAGDLLSAGILAWHPQRFDFVVCDGVWFPTGNYAPGDPTLAGKGYWGDIHRRRHLVCGCGQDLDGFRPQPLRVQRRTGADPHHPRPGVHDGMGGWQNLRK